VLQLRIHLSRLTERYSVDVGELAASPVLSSFLRKLIIHILLRVFVLERLTDDDIRNIVMGAINRISESSSPDVASTDGTLPSSSQASDSVSSQLSPSSQTISSGSQALFPSYPQITSQVLASIVSLSTGDARTALSLTELALSSSPSISPPTLIDSLRRSVSTSYDRTGDSHYDLISALHKSVRGSDGSAALYWLARMLSAGEDPVFIARRMVVCASEDVGLADNHAYLSYVVSLSYRLEQN
jgi:putative ATPase